MRDGSMYSLAQLYFLAEDYPKTVAVLNKWLGMVAEPSPEGYALLAQTHYQTQNFAEAEKALVTSMKISKSRNQVPKEAALALLRAIYYERKEYEKAAKVLEVLVTAYPGKGTYWQQLSGMYGLLDRQSDQTNLMHVAHRAKLVEKEGDLLNVARLYLIAEVPYPAVLVLVRGLKDKVIKRNVENLQLLAQALSLAREYKLQVPVLKELAEMSGESRHYVFLGQAYNELAEWDNAVSAFRSALKGKNVQNTENIQMQLGTALFNADQLQDARNAFELASGSENLKEGAKNWIKFVDNEIARHEAAKYLN
jgi:tetratricopeptide (TPR) repeat protein